MTTFDIPLWVRAECHPFPLGDASITDAARAILRENRINLERDIVRHVQDSSYGKDDDPYSEISQRVITSTITLSDVRSRSGQARDLWIVSAIHKRQTIICMDSEIGEIFDGVI